MHGPSLDQSIDINENIVLHWQFYSIIDGFDYVIHLHNKFIISNFKWIKYNSLTKDFLKHKFCFFVVINLVNVSQNLRFNRAFRRIVNCSSAVLNSSKTSCAVFIWSLSMTNPSLELQIFFSFNLISRPNIKFVMFSSLYINFLNLINSLSSRFSMICLSMSYWLKFWVLSSSFNLVIEFSTCCLCDLTFWRILILALSPVKSSANMKSLESKWSLTSILLKRVSINALCQRICEWWQNVWQS